MKTADGRGTWPCPSGAPASRGPSRCSCYVFNGGTSLYRLVCLAQTGQAAKYAPVFGHMAASLKVTVNNP